MPEVLRGESEHGWWELVGGLPAPPLRGAVRSYTGYREKSSAPVRRREVPTGDVTLILSFGPTIDVADPAGGLPLRLTSFVAPVDDTWAVTEYTGEQHGLEITLTPPGASRLLGVPMDELVGQALDLGDVVGAPGGRLAGQLADLPDWPSRFAFADRVLAGLLDRGRAPSPAAAWAWRRLTETDGRISISSLTAELGCSHRYLVTEFRRHIGVPPKTLARVLRCTRAIRLLERGGLRVGDVALSCGYSDQAHLNRDFRLLTGITPTRWGSQYRLGLPKPD